MKFLTKLWVLLTSFFAPVSPEKQAMLNVIKYIEENPHMWNQASYPCSDLNVPTCFGGLLLREMGIYSNFFGDLPMYEYLSRNCAFSEDKTLPDLKRIVNNYK